MNNPDNLPERAFTPEEAERRRLAALAESTLKFRKAAADTLDDLTCEMILDNCEMGGMKFRTPGGRNVMLVMAFGDTAVGALTDKLFELTNPNGEEDAKEERQGD